MKKDITIKINNISVTVPDGSTILDACHVLGIKVPTLCFLKKINEIGSCRMCLVEVKGARSLVASCVYPVTEGMEIKTHTPQVESSRKANLELILSTHCKECLSCNKSLHCELQRLAYEYECDTTKFAGAMPGERSIDTSSPSLTRDNHKCILCKRCKAVCFSEQNVKVIAVNKRGFESHIGCAYGAKLGETACVACGQCTLVCPTGALMEKNDVPEVIKLMSNSDYVNVVAFAPSVRVGLGEEFGMKIGTNVEGKVVTALRLLGFNYIFDIDFGADLTIVEEANEFIGRVTNKGVLPMLTSCSPGWIGFITAYYPELIPNLSTTKSPQAIFGAALKTFWAEKMNIEASKIKFITIMPCTAKKTEITRGKNALGEIPDVDVVLTVRELARLIKKQGIDFVNLKDSIPDDPMGESTGAGTIFGATGGVMEAALRTAADTLTGKDLKNIEYNSVRGTKGIKEATIDINGTKINVCVASGLKNATTVMESIKSGTKQYHFVEIMACPGGCVNGGGMPIHDPNEISFEKRAIMRAKGLYDDDKVRKYRKSHQNPSIISMYKDYFKKPGSHKAHDILHTEFKKKDFI